MPAFDDVKAGKIRRDGADPKTLNNLTKAVRRQGGLAIGSGSATVGPGGTLLNPDPADPTRWVRFKTGEPNADGLYEGYLLETVSNTDDALQWDDPQEKEIWLAQAGADPTKTVRFPLYSTQGETFFRFPAVHSAVTQDSGGDLRDLYLFEPYSFSAVIHISSGAPSSNVWAGTTGDDDACPVWVGLSDPSAIAETMDDDSYVTALYVGTKDVSGDVRGLYVIDKPGQGLTVDKYPATADVTRNTTLLEFEQGTNVIITSTKVADGHAKIKIEATGGGGGGAGSLKVWQHTVARFISGESVIIDSSQDWRGTLVVVWWTTIVIDWNETAGDDLPPSNFAYTGGTLFDATGSRGGPSVVQSLQYFCSTNGQADNDNIIIAPPTEVQCASVDAGSVVFVDTAGNLRYRRLDDGGGHSWSLFVAYSGG